MLRQNFRLAVVPGVCPEVSVEPIQREWRRR